MYLFCVYDHKVYTLLPSVYQILCTLSSIKSWTFCWFWGLLNNWGIVLRFFNLLFFLVLFGEGGNSVLEVG